MNSGAVCSITTNLYCACRSCTNKAKFFRSVSTASLSNTCFYIPSVHFDNSCNWQIVNSEADWDDESRQVELRIEEAVGISGTNNSAQITCVGFALIILASLPA